MARVGETDAELWQGRAFGSCISRRVLQIQKAVKQNPRVPDFTNLQAMLSSTLDETGGIVTSKFDEWVAGEQKTEAVIMKNQRLHAEEREAIDKAAAKAKGGGGRGGGP